MFTPLFGKIDQFQPDGCDRSVGGSRGPLPRGHDAQSSKGLTLACFCSPDTPVCQRLRPVFGAAARSGVDCRPGQGEGFSLPPPSCGRYFSGPAQTEARAAVYCLFGWKVYFILFVLTQRVSHRHFVRSTKRTSLRTRTVGFPPVHRHPSCRPAQEGGCDHPPCPLLSPVAPPPP